MSKSNDNKLKDKITLTRLEGMESFLSSGIMLGEFDSNTTVAELLSIIKSMKEEKNKNYQARLNSIKGTAIEDDNFR